MTATGERLPVPGAPMVWMLECNWPECPAYRDRLVGEPTTAGVAEIGWLRTPDGRHYCPRHVEQAYDGSFCCECGEDLPEDLTRFSIEYHPECAGVGADGESAEHDDNGQVD